MQRRDFFKISLLPSVAGLLPAANLPAQEQAHRMNSTEGPLRTVPFSLMDKQYRKQLFQTNPNHKEDFMPPLEAMNLVIAYDEAPGNFWEFRTEAAGLLTDAPGTFEFVVNENWKMSSSANWGYSGTTWRQEYSDREPRDTGIDISARTRREGNRVAMEVQVRNLYPALVRSVYVWICLGHWYAPAMSSKTLVRLQNHFAYYEQAFPHFWGPAGMRCYTPLGEKERKRLEQARAMVQPWPDSQIAEPVRCATGKINGRDFVAGIGSPDAAILGGYDSNPCTDVALLIGDLTAGAHRSARVAAYFGFGTPEDLWHWYEQTSFEKLFA